jgi:hypothetical protein
MTSESEQESRASGIFSTTLIVAAILAGIFLIWVGQLILIQSDWEDADAMEIAVKTSMTLISLGGALTSGALIGGGVFNKSIDKFVRLGMLVAAGFIIMQLMGTYGTFFPWTYLIR